MIKLLFVCFKEITNYFEFSRLNH